MSYLSSNEDTGKEDQASEHKKGNAPEMSPFQNCLKILSFQRIHTCGTMFGTYLIKCYPTYVLTIITLPPPLPSIYSELLPSSFGRIITISLLSFLPSLTHNQDSFFTPIVNPSPYCETLSVDFSTASKPQTPRLQLIHPFADSDETASCGTGSGFSSSCPRVVPIPAHIVTLTRRDRGWDCFQSW